MFVLFEKSGVATVLKQDNHVIDIDGGHPYITVYDCVNTRSGLEGPTQAGVSLSGGSFSTSEVAVDFAAHTSKFGFLTNLSTSTSRRYLDPPSIDNFHNLGRTGKGFFRLDYQSDQNNSLRGVFTFGGSNFDVANRLEQELAGQDQRQRLRDNSQSVTFQHIFSPDALGQFSIFNRNSHSNLLSNPSSTPVVALQDRNPCGLSTTLQRTNRIEIQVVGTLPDVRS